MPNELEIVGVLKSFWDGIHCVCLESSFAMYREYKRKGKEMSLCLLVSLMSLVKYPKKQLLGWGLNFGICFPLVMMEKVWRWEQKAFFTVLQEHNFGLANSSSWCWATTESSMYLSSFTFSDLLLLAWPHVLKLGETSPKALSAENQAFKHRCLWVTFHTQTIRAPIASYIIYLLHSLFGWNDYSHLPAFIFWHIAY